MNTDRWWTLRLRSTRNGRHHHVLSRSLRAVFWMAIMGSFRGGMPTADAAVLTLNDDTWFEEVDSKSVFLLLDEPSHPACRTLMEDNGVWSQLAAAWQHHPVGLVARIDCSDPQSAMLCDQFTAMAPPPSGSGPPLPILLYGDPHSPEFYTADDLSYEALSAFAQQHISTLPCSIYHMEQCDDTVRQILQGFMEQSPAALQALEEQIETRMATLEQTLETKIAAIQAEYRSLVEEFNTALDEIRDETHYKWLQQVLHDRELQAMLQEEEEGRSGEL